MMILEREDGGMEFATLTGGLRLLSMEEALWCVGGVAGAWSAQNHPIFAI